MKLILLIVLILSVNAWTRYRNRPVDFPVNIWLFLYLKELNSLFDNIFIERKHRENWK